VALDLSELKLSLMGSVFSATVSAGSGKFHGMVVNVLSVVQGFHCRSSSGCSGKVSVAHVRVVWGAYDMIDSDWLGFRFQDEADR
jgi:hypothetical protein